MLKNTISTLLRLAHYQKSEVEKRLKIVSEMWVDGNISDEEFDKDYLTLRTKKELVDKEIKYLYEELDKKTETEKEEEEEREKEYV